MSVDNYIKKVAESAIEKFTVKLSCNKCSEEWPLELPEGDRVQTGYELTSVITKLYLSNVASELTISLYCPKCASPDIKLIDKLR